eukprot:284816013_5
MSKLSVAEAIPDASSGRVTRIVVHPLESNVVAAGYIDGSVRLWDLSSKKLLATFSGHRSGISALEFRWVEEECFFLILIIFFFLILIIFLFLLQFGRTPSDFWWLGYGRCCLGRRSSGALPSSRSSKPGDRHSAPSCKVERCDKLCKGVIWKVSQAQEEISDCGHRGAGACCLSTFHIFPSNPSCHRQQRWDSKNLGYGDAVVFANNFRGQRSLEHRRKSYRGKHLTIVTVFVLRF